MVVNPVDGQPADFVKGSQLKFAYEGEPLDVYLMREKGWLPWEIDRIPNRKLMEMLAAERLAAERSR